jgi:hypothetical protein
MTCAFEVRLSTLLVSFAFLRLADLTCIVQPLLYLLPCCLLLCGMASSFYLIVVEVTVCVGQPVLGPGA